MSELHGDAYLEVVQHIFLPPELPHKAGSDCSQHLLTTSLETLRKIQTDYATDLSADITNAVSKAITSLQHLKQINASSTIDPGSLNSALHGLQDGDSLAMFVTEQNAAVSVTRTKGKLIFEQFEVSPSNAAVYATNGRLVRSFPATAIAVEQAMLSDNDFTAQLAGTLSTLSSQPVPEMKVKTKKAGKHHEEVRDTARPDMVSTWLMSVLLALGEVSQLSTISKNTREEVLHHNALLPWRRAPMWLLIRVCLQLTLTRAYDGKGVGNALYKVVTTFIMHQLVQSPAWHHLTLDLRHVMLLKISRRLHKLEQYQAIEPLAPLMNTISKAAHLDAQSMNGDWLQTQRLDSRALDLGPLRALDFEFDTHMHIDELDNRTVSSAKPRSNATSFRPFSDLVVLSPDELPSLDCTGYRSDNAYAIANLHSFEAWVSNHCLAWCANEQECAKLFALMQRYHQLATDAYGGNPLGTSAMVLTMFELWVAIDRCAISQCDILSDYSPDINVDVLQNLCLPDLSQLQRLKQVEDYLHTRVGKFSQHLYDHKHPRSFASRYVQQSQLHQSLLQSIKTVEERKRAAKLEELAKVQREHKHWSDLFDSLTQCDMKTVVVDSYQGRQWTEERHSPRCQRCQYKHRRDALKIQPFEELLPQDEVKARVIVFELQVPSFFAAWREARFFMLRKVLLGQRQRQATHFALRLEKDAQLGSGGFYKVASVPGTIGLQSTIKPVLRSHYGSMQLFGLTQADVQIRAGADFQYWDYQQNTPVGAYTFTTQLAKACTYRPGHKSLHRFVCRPASLPNGPPSNTAIAAQSTCPDDMTTEEFRDLSSLPLGRHIQWSKILLELSMPSVDFKRLDTALVFLQCIHQTGPSNGTILRDNHATLEHDAFDVTLLQAVEIACDRIRDNWESASALTVLIAIALKLLNVTKHTQEKAIVVLEHLSETAVAWVRCLRERMHQATSDSERDEFRERSCEVALICASAFDVPRTHLETMLANPTNVARFVQMSEIINENKRSLGGQSMQLLGPLLLRHRALSLRSYQLIAHNTAGLDLAMSEIWAGYRPARGWNHVADAEGWVTQCLQSVQAKKNRRARRQGHRGVVLKDGTLATFDSGHDDDLPSVHINLLSGEVLVDGRRLSRLPATYEQQPLYHVLFGNTVLEVAPSSIPGFEFSTKVKHHGYRLDLCVTSAPSTHSNLLQVRIEAVDGQVLEFIDGNAFKQFLPRSYAEDYVHWLDTKLQTVVFSPRERPWDLQTGNALRLARTADGSWQLLQGSTAVLALQSTTAAFVSDLLSPLTPADDVHCMLDLQAATTLHVIIPRLNLRFQLAAGTDNLVCNDYRMSVDRDQHVGTLTGLVNKLVLKSKQDASRMVLIPEGTLSWQRHKEHVRVTIEHAKADTVHAIRIDEHLQQLRGSTEHHSIMYLAYLHALTSSCLPDAFSGCTGTERALDLLDCGAAWSFETLSSQDTDLLLSIGKLSPQRYFYPPHLEQMQTVTNISDLGFFAQHDLFSVLVEKILAHADRMQIFYPHHETQRPQAIATNHKLRERALRRFSCLRTSTYGAEWFDTGLDQSYVGRDSPQSSERARNVTLVASAYLKARISTVLPTPDITKLWSRLSEPATLHGFRTEAAQSHLCYDARHLLKDSNRWINFLPTARELTLATDADKYAWFWWFTSSSFAADVDVTILQTLLLFKVDPALAVFEPPRAASFTLKNGCTLQKAKIETAVTNACLSFENTPEFRTARKPDESKAAYHNRREQLYRSARSRAIETDVPIICQQWPSSEVSISPLQASASHVDLGQLKQTAGALFKTWSENSELFSYLRQLVAQLQRASEVQIPISHMRRQVTMSQDSMASHVSVIDLYQRQAPKITLQELALDRHCTSTGPITARRNDELTQLIGDLQQQAVLSKHETSYAIDLDRSRIALEQQSLWQGMSGETAHPASLKSYQQACQSRVTAAYQSIVTVLRNSQSVEEVIRGPRLSPAFILHQLSRASWTLLSKDWQTAISSYGLALTQLQRARRMSTAAILNDGSLHAEMSNVGHENWKPAEYPDSLLMEIESNILIRKAQGDIAAEMCRPSIGKNAVMQMNMGEGKSSTIAPIVLASLATGSELVRAVTGKAQAKQMAQMLIAKLGGLVDRRLYRLPISRSLKLSETQANTIYALLQECIKNGAVLLVQPEHLLSLQLMVAETAVAKQSALSASLAQMLQLFETARDLVDEADDIYSVDYELVYTMGEQAPIDFSPDRWILIFELFDIAHIAARNIAALMPGSIEVKPAKSGAFPRIRILRSDAEEAINRKITEHICEHGVGNLTIHWRNHAVKEAVRTYILTANLTQAQIDAIEQGPFWNDDSKEVLLLLRGMLSQGVLNFVLRKRWRVNYGLTPDRQPPTRLAVPYKAKDSPNPRSEFSHTDVVIMLTTLSTYYGGLSDDIMFATVSHLLNDTNADIEFQSWVAHAPVLASSFRQLGGINLKDRSQCTRDIFPHLRHVKPVIDYYLAQLVFPKEMRVFPLKLSCSGWDLGKQKANLVTGFSGTRDSRILLPLDMHQLELPAHKHTDALVLSHLLQPQTGIELMSLPPHSKSDSEHLLDVIMQLSPAVQVVLDVGAQILELSNQQFAEAWLLRHETSKEAVVFVNDDDEVCVLDRKGRCEQWSMSHYQNSTHLCLVYLDEAHTRGIDIRLPSSYRAATTLAPKITKDKLMQACMRMRKLGSGQTVVFCIPNEVQGSILSATGKADATHISVKDVLQWSIGETHMATRRNAPLWAMQGKRFDEQQEDWALVERQADKSKAREAAVNLQEQESSSIAESYGPSADTGSSTAILSDTPRLQQITSRCKEIDGLSFDSAALQQQQERELAPEIQAEREVERARPAEPAKHTLHPDVRAFARQAIVKQQTSGYAPAFSLLSSTSVARMYDVNAVCKSGKLLASHDFGRAVQSRNSFDIFERPVQWLLVRCIGDSDEVDTVLLISPFEANELFPEMIKGSCKSSLHIFRARCNAGYRPLHNLDLGAVPNQRSIRMPQQRAIELILFAGQLCISSYDEYKAICRALGLTTQIVPKDMEEAGFAVDKNGFILSDEHGRAGGDSGLTASPVHFFKTFFSKIRRNGESIARTQLGRVLEGALLQEEEFN